MVAVGHTGGWLYRHECCDVTPPTPSGDWIACRWSPVTTIGWYENRDDCPTLTHIDTHNLSPKHKLKNVVLLFNSCRMALVKCVEWQSINKPLVLAENIKYSLQLYLMQVQVVLAREQSVSLSVSCIINNLLVSSDLSCSIKSFKKSPQSFRSTEFDTSPRERSQSPKEMEKFSTNVICF